MTAPDLEATERIPTLPEDEEPIEEETAAKQAAGQPQQARQRELRGGTGSGGGQLFPTPGGDK